MSEREDRNNVLRKIRKTCSRCSGTGFEPGPSKGKARFRRKAPEEEKSPEEMTLEEQTRAFLRSHGC